MNAEPPATHLRWLRQPAAAVYAAVGLVLFVLLVLLPEAGVVTMPEVTAAGGGETAEATVRTVRERDVRESAAGAVRTEEIVVHPDGAAEPVVIERVTLAADPFALALAPGDRVLLTRVDGPAGPTYLIVDRVRTAPLMVLGLAFAVLVVVVGRWRGLWSLVGLAASALVLMRFVIPAILSGWEPVVATLIGAVVILLTTLVLAHGVNWKTGAALAGTACSLMAAITIAALGVEFANLTGFADEEAVTLQITSGGTIEARGILLSGIIIGALGVLDDVTTTQAATVFELRRANPLLGAAELTGRALNVGRDHIASTVNTLVLAYAGAALPLVVLLAAQPEPLDILLSRELIATEVVRTLAGSIGIIAAVPITTALAAAIAARGYADPPAPTATVDAARGAPTGPVSGERGR